MNTLSVIETTRRHSPLDHNVTVSIPRTLNLSLRYICGNYLPWFPKSRRDPVQQQSKGLNSFVSWRSNGFCLPKRRPRDQQVHNNSIFLIITVEFINYHYWVFSEQIAQHVCGLSDTIMPLLVGGCETWSLILKNIGRGCSRIRR